MRIASYTRQLSLQEVRGGYSDLSQVAILVTAVRVQLRPTDTTIAVAIQLAAVVVRIRIIISTKVITNRLITRSSLRESSSLSLIAEQPTLLRAHRLLRMLLLLEICRLDDTTLLLAL
jgi:hypothetical protein